MASWRKRLDSKTSNHSRKPIIIAVGEQGNARTATTHVATVEITPVVTNKAPQSLPAVSATQLTKSNNTRVSLEPHQDLSGPPKVADEPDSLLPKNDNNSRLLDLPVDVILHLSHHLTYNSLLALRSTCRSLHSILSTDHVSTIRTRLMLNYLADEAMQRAAYRRVHPRYGRDTLWDLFAIAFEWQLLERPVKELRCYECLEVKPLRMFVERMSSKGTGLGGRYARQRRCKSCMRRGMNIAGIWWREHWLRRNETVRRTGRVERYVGWAVRGTEPTKVKRGEEIGVCAGCGTGQFELFWGCAGCFEKEQTRRRREEWSMIGVDTIEDAQIEGWVKWALEKSEAWRRRRDKKKRERQARRAECGGRWFNPRRYAGWMGIDVRWRGSWAERVESLVDHLEENYQRRARLTPDAPADTSAVLDGVDVHDNRSKTNSNKLKANKEATAGEGTTTAEWRAADQSPPQKDRREARCAMCWTPSCQRRRYISGLAYGPRLELDRCCEDCQEEERGKEARRVRGRGRRRGQGDADAVGRCRVQDEAQEEGLEGLEELFAGGRWDDGMNGRWD